MAVQCVGGQAPEGLGAEPEESGGPAALPDPVDLVRDDAEGVGAVAVGTALPHHQPVDVLVDLPQRAPFAHLAQDQIAVRFEVGEQPVVHGVEAEAAGS